MKHCKEMMRLREWLIVKNSNKQNVNKPYYNINLYTISLQISIIFL